MDPEEFIIAHVIQQPISRLLNSKFYLQNLLLVFISSRRLFPKAREYFPKRKKQVEDKNQIL